MTKEKQDGAITLNGIRFSPAMMEALQEWYASPIPEEQIPMIMIKSLQNVQRCLIELSECQNGKDEATMNALRQLMYVQDYLKPFTEGGAVNEKI